MTPDIFADPFTNAVCLDCGETPTIERVAKTGDRDRFLKRCLCSPDWQRIDVTGIMLRCHAGDMVEYILSRLRVGFPGAFVTNQAECRHCGAPDDGKRACYYCGTVRQQPVSPPAPCAPPAPSFGAA